MNLTSDQRFPTGSRLLETAREFARSAYKCSEWPNDVQMIGLINAKHLKNALQSYAAYDRLAEIPILLMVNDIMWKRGETGLLMTDRKLYFNINKNRGTKELRENTAIHIDPLPPYSEDNGELEDKSEYQLFVDTLKLGSSFTYRPNVYALSLFLDAMYGRRVISDELISGFYSPDQFSPLVSKIQNEGVHDRFPLIKLERTLRAGEQWCFKTERTIVTTERVIMPYYRKYVYLNEIECVYSVNHRLRNQFGGKGYYPKYDQDRKKMLVENLGVLSSYIQDGATYDIAIRTTAKNHYIINHGARTDEADKVVKALNLLLGS